MCILCSGGFDLIELNASIIINFTLGENKTKQTWKHGNIERVEYLGYTLLLLIAFQVKFIAVQSSL